MENLFENKKVKLNKSEIIFLISVLQKKEDQILASSGTPEQKLRYSGRYSKMSSKLVNAL